MTTPADERRLANIQCDGRPVAGAEPGNTRAASHGAYSRVVEPRAAVIEAELRTLLPVASASDAPAIRALARVEARIEIVSEWLAQHGLLRAGDRPQPILRSLSTWENTALRLYEHLGLTPAARLRLGLEVVRARDAARAFAERMTRQELDDFLERGIAPSGGW